MKRIACTALSLCLVLLMFPTAALAESGRSGFLAVSGTRLGTSDAQLQSADSTSSGDVKHVISKTLGTHVRTVPEATDFHEAFGVTNGYPAYNGNFNADVTSATNAATAEAQEAAVVAENAAILDYTAIDANGNLYKDSVRKTASADGKTVTQLVRHTAGVSNYGKAIPDDAPSVTKLLSLRMLRYGNLVTGLYAPPGEVVKVTLKSTSADSAPKDLGLKALIGTYSGTDGRSAITDTGTFDLTRMPDTGISLDLSSEENYIGSPLGGPILIYSSGIGGTTVQMEIEGAVEMPTYFYGEMSDEELAEQLAKPAPYFAFSTPRGIRAVGPAFLVRDLPASQIKGAMEFWDKAIGVSYQFEAGSFDPADPDTDLMVEMFDPYIPYVGAEAVNAGTYCICPIKAGASFFDPDGLVTNGSWTTIHELNHSFPWGGAVDNTQEVTNNVINALTYQLYTNVAAQRVEPTDRNNYKTIGLSEYSDWNTCADMFTTMERIRQTSKETYPNIAWGQQLQVYVPLQHAFGADRFLNAVHLYHEKGGKYKRKLSGNALYTNSNVWMRAASEASGYDLGYYMRDVQEFPELPTGDENQTDYITTDVRKSLADVGPLYIPSGCIYASGVVYEASSGEAAGAAAVVGGKGALAADAFANGKDVVEMGRPLRIPYGKAKTLYFNPATEGGRVSVANGESVEMVGYTAPQHGALEATGNDLQLKYTPDSNNLSDCFYVTLKLTVTDDDSPYKGASQNVTFKVSLLQDTSQVGFSTTFYDWPKTLAEYNAEDDPIQTAIDNGVLKQIPLSTQVKSIAGFDGPGLEPSGRFAVVEGEIRLTQTGLTNLGVRGNVSISTCVALSADDLPPASSAQSKVKSGSSGFKPFLSVFVVDDPETESVVQGSQAIVHVGETLHVRAYVAMPYNCTCYYRIGYKDATTNNSYREFDPAAITGTIATTALETPAIADFTAEKVYSYPDTSLLATALRSFKQTSKTITCTNAWNASRGNLSARSGTIENITDGNLASHFHSSTSGTDFAAEFVFELGNPDEFNAIRYKGHCTDPTRGKFGGYELYVGTDRNAVLEADASDPLLVSQGTAAQACDEGEFNYISWDEAVTGKYIRLVVTSSYPFNNQYYYAFSDFTVGTYDSVTGEGVIGTCNRVGSWDDDGNVFANTRNPLRISSKGVQWVDFNGTGVILYATTSSGYGTMLVTLDGDTTEVALDSANTQPQRAVFWKSRLDAAKTHRLVVAPKTPGTDTINVDNVEVKGTPDSASAFPAAPKSLAVQTERPSYPYTGADIEPPVIASLDGIDVSDICSLSYENNKAAGTATVTATVNDDASQSALTAGTTFKIAKAVYGGAMKTSFAGGAESYRYAQQESIPQPQVSGMPGDATAAFYYSASSTGAGEPWDAGAMTSTSLEPGTYFLWAVVSAPNYEDATTPRFSFKVEPASTGDEADTPAETTAPPASSSSQTTVSPSDSATSGNPAEQTPPSDSETSKTDVSMGTLGSAAIRSVKTYPTSLVLAKQTAAGIKSTSGITFDIYVKSAAKGSRWVKKASALSASTLKAKGRKLTGLKQKTAYRYKVIATKKAGGKVVATSTWTSGKIKTGANVKPVIKSAKVSKVRVTKRGKKSYTSYKLKVTLKKKLGNGTVGVMTSDGKYAKGKGKTFSFTFKNVAGNKKGKKASVKLYGYTSKAYGGYTNPSKAVKYKIA